MDVDAVVQLTSNFYSNLTDEQKRFLQMGNSAYGWSDFRSDVLQALKIHFGVGNIKEGDKTIKVGGTSGRLPIDVIASVEYRKYLSLNIKDYVEGMTFWAKALYRQIINYPKLHYENGVKKNSATGGYFKPCVRILKNIRDSIMDTAPSYFLECLCYNAPTSGFGKNYQQTLFNLVSWLSQEDLSSFVKTGRTACLDLPRSSGQSAGRTIF